MRVLGFVLLSLVAVGTSGAESEKDWVENRAKYEDWLLNAEVLEVADIGHGVTNPKKVTLKMGDVVFHAVYKPIKRGRQGGFWESYQAEIAAYELDKLVGLGMVPPTVARRVGSEMGSLQLWVPGCKLYKEVEGKFTMTPAFSQDISRMKMFDNLIFNDDRNAGNFLLDEEDRVVLIDHSRAFIDRKNLLKGGATKQPAQYDRSIVERLKALTLEELEPPLKELLMGGQIKSILLRRDQLLEHMKELIEKQGEAAALFQ